MEGFVSVSVHSPFDRVGKYSSRHNGYGVETYIKREQINNTQQNQTTTKTNPSEPISSDQYIKENYIDPIKEISVTDIDKTIVDTVTTDDDSQRNRVKAAVLIGGSALAAGGIVLGLTRGNLSKYVAKLSENFMNFATNKIDKIKQKPSTSKFEGKMLSFLQKANNTALMIRGTVFNITPLKDVLFEKLVAGKMRLKKPCDKITNLFRKLSFSTVKSSYKKTSKNLNSMTSQFTEMNERIAAGEFGSKAQSVIPELTEKLDKTNIAFQHSFGADVLEHRNQSMTAKLQGLGTRVYDAIYGNLKDFIKDVDAWTTFLPERMVAPQKKKIVSSLAAQKRVITNNPKDNYNAFTETFVKISSIINPKHEPSRDLLKTIREITKKYPTLSGAGESAERAEIVQKLNEQIKRSKEIINSDTYNPAKAAKLSGLFKELGNTLNGDKKGFIEEMLTTYKEILPATEYAKLKKSAESVTKTLNKAVQQEGSEYFDKARDFATGSALTDVAIGMAVPVVTTGIAMSAANTKEKKRSVALRYGLPLLSGIATSTACTLKLISGGKALMLGVLVSIVGNRIFEKIDKKLIEKSKEKSDNQIQNS